jgi:F-box protein 9
MDANKPGLDSELDSFRAKWLSDLRSKRDGPGESSHSPSASGAASASASRAPRRDHKLPASAAPAAPLVVDEDEHLPSRNLDEHHAPPESASVDPTAQVAKGKLVSALDHYEAAMVKEAQGNMGESLKLYRQAYRLDHRVDRRYREKHFPASSAPAPAPGPTPAPASTPKPHSGTPQQPTPAPVPVSATTTTEASAPQTMDDLIASLADLKIEPAGPLIEGTPPPPCPIATLPDELLLHILEDVAVDDVGDFVRLSLVCRHLAYLTATEQRIWRRVCVGTEVGFSAMHYHWQAGVAWEPLDAVIVEEPDSDSEAEAVSLRELQQRRRDESLTVTRSLVPGAYASWQAMFRSRPRIRFNGCYICTVNYVRAGEMSTNQATWGGSLVHIVTYYRYLRFFRDGTAISLLTTDEPADVVHHLTRDLLRLHRGDATTNPGAGTGHRVQSHHHAHLPSAVMHQALRGRWRLSSAVDHPDASNPHDQEGDLYIETEGVGPKYMYRMDLSLRNPGTARPARNNRRLFWRSFWSHNRLTDDWAPFTLKNEKPFHFSRVKSYGAGE